jgi:peroxiredoxin
MLWAKALILWRDSEAPHLKEGVSNEGSLFNFLIICCKFEIMRQVFLIIAFISSVIFELPGKPIVVQGYICSKFSDSIILAAYQDISDYLTGSKVAVKKITPNSNFFFQFIYDASGGTEFNLRTKVEYIFENVYLLPGDTLNVEYRDTDKDKNGIFRDRYPNFSGGGKGAAEFQKLLGRDFYLENTTQGFKGLAKISLDSFKNYLSARISYFLNLLDSKAIDLKLTPEFMAHERLYIIYASCELILWQSRTSDLIIKNRNLNILDYIPKYQLENRDALNVISYYQFIYAYLTCIVDRKCFLRPDSKNHWNGSKIEYKHAIDSLFSGIYRNIGYGIMCIDILRSTVWLPADKDITNLQMIDNLLADLEKSSDSEIKVVYKYDFDKRNDVCSNLNRVDPAVFRNDFAPEFKLPNLKGQLISLNDFKGKYVLLHFWSPDSEIIRNNAGPNNNLIIHLTNEIHGFQHIQEELKNSDFIILYIFEGSDKNVWKNYAALCQLPGIQLLDSSGIVESNYQNFHPLFSVLISRDSKVLEIYKDKPVLDIEPLILDFIKP